MSFTVDSRGRMYVLDQVNKRILRFNPDGTFDTSFPMDRPNAQDIALADDGSMAVLERFGGEDVALYDENGAVVGHLPLVGEGIETAGDVTGVFVDNGEVYVEREHSELVHVGNTKGEKADPRDTLPGRPSRDGLSYLKAGITDAAAGRAYVVSTVRETGDHRFTRELRLKALIQGILLLDTDLSGTIYFAAEVQDETGGASVILTCLDPLSGIPVGAAVLPANDLPEESFRDLVVLDGGGVIYSLRTEEGVSYKQYDCK